MLLLFVLLLQSFLSGNTQVLGRLFIAAFAVAFIITLRQLSRHLHYAIAAHALVGFYMLLAIGSVVAWGIRIPFGILLLGLMIVLASTILSSRYALYAAVIATITVITVQQGYQSGWLVSQVATDSGPAELGDAIGHSVVFAILATVSWLFGREMERSLVRAEAAEVELEREKATLEVRVAKRTEQLKEAQIEEMRQLYNFAEVGQLSTSLLHDLANHLAVLTIEIEDMGSQRHTEQLERSRRILTHLNSMLDVVRDRLAGATGVRSYNLVDVLNEVIDIATLKDIARSVQVDWHPPKNKKPFAMYGDPVKCGQALAIVIGNAVDAYKSQLGDATLPAKIAIGLEVDKHQIIVQVTDWGIGIPIANTENIFKPSFSTKTSGMGIGLYLARQIIENECKGSLVLASPQPGQTTFVAVLPKERRVR